MSLVPKMVTMSLVAQLASMSLVARLATTLAVPKLGSMLPGPRLVLMPLVAQLVMELPASMSQVSMFPVLMSLGSRLVCSLLVMVVELLLF